MKSCNYGTKSKGTILNLFIQTGNHTYTIRDLSTPLPLGSILLAININQKLQTIIAKSKGTILNLFIKTGNHTNTIRDLSMPLSLGAISLAIDINQKLTTINAKSNGTILNLFIKTGNDYFLAVNTAEFLYQLVYLGFHMLQVKVNRRNNNSYVVIYITYVKTIMLHITAQLK